MVKINLKSEFLKYKRVWRLLKKPTMKEFKLTTMVSAIGLLVIGAIGFLISVVMNFII